MQLSIKTTVTEHFFTSLCGLFLHLCLSLTRCTWVLLFPLCTLDQGVDTGCWVCMIHIGLWSTHKDETFYWNFKSLTSHSMAHTHTTVKEVIDKRSLWVYCWILKNKTLESCFWWREWFNLFQNHRSTLNQMTNCTSIMLAAYKVMVSYLSYQEFFDIVFTFISIPKTIWIVIFIFDRNCPIGLKNCRGWRCPTATKSIQT